MASTDDVFDLRFKGESASSQPPAVICDQTTPTSHVLSVPPPLRINQWRLRSLEKNPEESGLSRRS